MKFVPKELNQAAENSSGGGPRGMRREALVLTLLMCLTVTLLYLTIGWVTDFAVSRITPEQEQKLFAGVNFGNDSDEAPEEYLEKWQLSQQILDKLVEFPEVPEIDFQLSIYEDAMLNAFALPGGGIALTQGLLDQLDEEIAIAFIIAHELGHFAGRDHLQGMGRQIGFGIAIQLLTGGSPDGLTNSAMQLVNLGYSREQESAADAFAIRCIDYVYGRRDGAERLFKLLQEESTLPSWAYMFQTHPDNEKRIQAIVEAE
ncbi:MAG: M48 family metallopeptidase [Verrucomicrobiota bacterium]